MSNLTPAEITNAPTISLGGRRFHIPRLAIKQNRVVVSGLKTIMPIIGRLEQTAKMFATSPEAAGTALLSDFPIDPVAFEVLCDVVYAAVTRGDREMTRAQFDDLPLGVDELLLALPVILNQSFAFAAARVPGGQPAAAPSGEAPAPAPALTAETSPGIGTSS